MRRRGLRLRLTMAGLVLAAVAAGWSHIAGQTRPADGPSATQPAGRPATRPAQRTPTDIPDRIARRLGQTVAEHHGLAFWQQRIAVEADIAVEMHGRPILEGTLLTEVQGGRSRIDLKSGASMAFDTFNYWVSPAGAEVGDAVSHVRLWPFLLTAPLRLAEPNVRHAAYKPWGDKNTHVVTFQSDHPWSDQWFFCYSTPKFYQLHALAFSSNFDGTPVDDSGNHHAVVFDEYETIDGITLAKAWTFVTWHANRGLDVQPIGKATISNIKFVRLEERAFVMPMDARVVAPAATKAATQPATPD